MSAVIAAYVLPRAGSVFGACVEDCDHEYCGYVRRLAATPCGYCARPIGYGVRYYEVGGAFAHAECFELNFERSISD